MALSLKPLPQRHPSYRIDVRGNDNGKTIMTSSRGLNVDDSIRDLASLAVSSRRESLGSFLPPHTVEAILSAVSSVRDSAGTLDALLAGSSESKHHVTFDDDYSIDEERRRLAKNEGALRDDLKLSVETLEAFMADSWSSTVHDMTGDNDLTTDGIQRLENNESSLRDDLDELKDIVRTLEAFLTRSVNSNVHGTTNDEQDSMTSELLRVSNNEATLRDDLAGLKNTVEYLEALLAHSSSSSLNLNGTTSTTYDASISGELRMLANNEAAVRDELDGLSEDPDGDMAGKLLGPDVLRNDLDKACLEKLSSHHTEDTVTGAPHPINDVEGDKGDVGKNAPGCSSVSQGSLFSNVAETMEQDSISTFTNTFYAPPLATAKTADTGPVKGGKRPSHVFIKSGARKQVTHKTTHNAKTPQQPINALSVSDCCAGCRSLWESARVAMQTKPTHRLRKNW